MSKDSDSENDTTNSISGYNAPTQTGSLFFTLNMDMVWLSRYF